jgi:hypothetical protein
LCSEIPSVAKGSLDPLSIPLLPPSLTTFSSSYIFVVTNNFQ